MSEKTEHLNMEAARISDVSFYFKTVRLHMGGRAYLGLVEEQYFIFGFDENDEIVKLSDLVDTKFEAWENAAKKIGIDVDLT